MRAPRAAGGALLLAALAAPAAAGDNVAAGGDGFRLVESTVAAVNGEVVFLSNVRREACFLACGAFPGEEPAATSLARARELYIADVLVLQEQRKLGLGGAENAALREVSAEARGRMARCGAPCAAEVDNAAIDEYVGRRLLVRDFLVKRVSVFVEVTDEEVQMEAQRRRDRAGPDAPAPGEEELRKELTEERTGREIRNWFSRAASKARIVLSPLEEK